jgi:sulfatase maturation enzyme AslB (radical SAM superfamily)
MNTRRDNSNRKMLEGNKRLFYFNINFDCNNNCIFCAAGSKETRALRKRMSLAQISRILNDFNVGAKDTVVINGGEPTVHPEITSILSAATSRDAFVYLFTNGIKFSDINFVYLIAETGVNRVAIPIYSHIGKVHDSLTRHKGSFIATINGIRNLFAIKEQHGYPIEIELKTLICKRNLGHLPHIVNLVLQSLPQPDYFLISSMHISNAIGSSKNSIVPRLSSCASIIRQSVDIAVAAGLYVCLYYIPLCILGDQKYAEICDKNRYRSDKEPDFYFDSSVPNGITNMVNYAKGRNCINCCFNSRCDGIWDSYAREFGFDDLHPISIL